MKTPSNTLFLLINKMTPSEKRYFKRFGLVQQKKMPIDIPCFLMLLMNKILITKPHF